MVCLATCGVVAASVSKPILGALGIAGAAAGISTATKSRKKQNGGRKYKKRKDREKKKSIKKKSIKKKSIKKKKKKTPIKRRGGGKTRRRR